MPDGGWITYRLSHAFGSSGVRHIRLCPGIPTVTFHPSTSPSNGGLVTRTHPDMTTHALNADLLWKKHDVGLSYDAYLATDPAKAPAWRAIGDQVALNAEQRELLAGFTRDMKVICISGTWCGDCVQQGPLIQHIADASPRIDLRWLDRDEHMDLARLVRINAGDRVPVVLFMAEDYELVSYLGDRTLTRYRAIAARTLGPACPIPGAPVPTEELAATLQEWLNEFERVQLLLRLSTRLRGRYGD